MGSKKLDTMSLNEAWLTYTGLRAGTMELTLEIMQEAQSPWLKRQFAEAALLGKINRSCPGEAKIPLKDALSWVFECIDN